MTDLEKLTGPVLRPGDPGYDEERRTQNLLTPLRPAIAVGAADVADVRAAVRYAAANRLAVAVRGGGHMQPYTAEGAVLITLDRMAGVTVDAGRRTARVTGGALWREVIDAAAKEGLAPMAGSSVTVGAIGYVLGGGQGPILSRPYGYASDHVTSFDIVTADGELRTVSGDDELFAALRGPPIPQLPEPLRGAHVLSVRFAHLGPAEEGEALLAPMRAVAPALIDTVAEVPFAVAATLHNDPVDASPYQDRSLGLSGLPDAALDKLIELTGPGTRIPLTSVEVRALGGAMDRPPATPDSVPSRGLPFQLSPSRSAPTTWTAATAASNGWSPRCGRGRTRDTAGC
ncbi:FAD-dependent oxidoreductase [Actinoplanes sp. NPDC048796]|uniref:FAD-binding oxidoreductase n=1 Tax=Actinoplanes sp. NPDC048796 TaxID=3155640 RepID=UPI00340E2B43